MLLALRYDLPDDAPLNAKMGASLIETRIVTKYPHGGIVIGNDLYHANVSHGTHVIKDADLTGYVLINLGTELDERALKIFKQIEGTGYDWFSLFAFVLVPTRDSERHYCYELCYLMMTGRIPCERVTPETLSMLSLSILEVLETPLAPFKDMEFKLETIAV